jgi:hypothetical protein
MLMAPAPVPAASCGRGCPEARELSSGICRSPCWGPQWAPGSSQWPRNTICADHGGSADWGGVRAQATPREGPGAASCTKTRTSRDDGSASWVGAKCAGQGGRTRTRTVMVPYAEAGAVAPQAGSKSPPAPLGARRPQYASRHGASGHSCA